MKMEGKFGLENALKKGIQYVEHAEKIQLKYWPGNSKNKAVLPVKYKEDQSPTTKADSEVEKYIKQKINEDFPDHGIIGEESYESLDVNQDYTWIIDPLDGTKRYLRGHKTFSTQLALAYKGEIILGISNAPVLNERYWALKERGAFLNGKRIHVSNTAALSEGYISYANIRYFIENNTIKPLQEIIMNTSWSRGYGDFISYQMVAKGEIDACIEVFTCIWDIAALSLIVKEAGGMATDIDGEPINLKTDSCIASNGLFHNQLVKYFQKESENRIYKSPYLH